MRNKFKPPRYRRKRVVGKSGTYTYAVVTLRDGETGRARDLPLGDFGSPESRARYLRVVADWESHGRRLPPPQSELAQLSDGVSVTQLVAAYLDSEGVRSLSARQQNNIFQAVRILRQLFANEPAAGVGPNRLRDVREAMVHGDPGDEARKPRVPWARTTCNRRTKLIVQMYRWAVAHELMSPATYDALRTIEPLKRGRTTAHEPPPVRCVSEEHVRATLPWCSPTIRAMIRLQLLTGMRPAEVCRLRERDIDTSGELWVYRPAEHKTAWRGKGRTVYFGPRARRLLAVILRRWPTTGYLFSPVRAEAERRAAQHAARTTPMSCGNRPGTNRVAEPARPPGEVYDVAAYRRAITRACDEAGVPHWAPNQLRHSFATRVRREHGLEAAQLLLGHSSALVTDAVYADRDEGLMRAVARRMG